jgi:nucleoside-diphosphate-sugar epimerase
MAGSKKAVVIGGAGFVGRRLITLLSGADGVHPGWPRFDHLHVADVTPFVERAEAKAARERAGVTLTSSLVDVTRREDVEAAVEGAHTVFHLASIVDVDLTPNPRITAVNVEGTKHVVRACQAKGVPFLVYTSTEDVVLSERPVSFGDESLPYPSRPLCDYVGTKVEAERFVRENDGKDGLRTVVIRPVHVYGPEDPHAIVQSLAELKKGLPFVLGDGKARFDIVYVDNVAHGHLLAAKRLEDPASRDRVGGQAYFIGEDNAPNYFEFIRPYAEAHGIRLPRLKLPFGPLSVVARGMELAHRALGLRVPFHRFHLYILAQDFFFSHEKAARELGYAPLVPPDEALRRTLAWVETLRL